MWKISSLTLAGALIAVGYGMTVFPEFQNIFFHVLTFTGGLFVFSFTRSIFESK